MDIKRSYHGQWRVGAEDMWFEGYLRLYRGGAIALELLGDLEEMSMISQASPSGICGRVGDLRLFLSRLDVDHMSPYRESQGVLALVFKVGIVIIGREDDELALFKYRRVQLKSKLYKSWVDRREVEWTREGEYVMDPSRSPNKFHHLSLDDLGISLHITSVFSENIDVIQVKYRNSLYIY